MSNYSDSAFDAANQNTSWFKVYELVPEGAQVLDIGCSSGNFGEVLIERKHCTVDGIELDPKDVALAKKKLRNVWNLNVEYDDLKEIGKGKYDVIYFGDVIEHLVQPIQTLERVKALLNKNGVILFSIPNMGHVSVRLDLLGGSFQYTETGLLDKTHLHFYTQPEVVRVFSEAGYKIEKLDFVKKDYPKELLKKYLAKYGLTGNKTFYEQMASTNASAFQFVGIAKPAAAKRKRLPEFGPIDMFESFFEDTKKGYEQSIEELKKELARVSAELEEKAGVLARKTEHPYRAAAGHLKRKLKG